MGGDEVVKIGDFGISRELSTVSDMAKTSCGTPYFMSPEVVRGEPYNAKSDMWALGCVLYELSTFGKPFDSNSISGLYEQIKTREFAPLPSDTDPVMRMLVGALLNKDPNKRPSVWEFAKIPEIKNRINKFVELHNCYDMVAHVLQIETKGKPSKSDKEETKGSSHTIQLDFDKLDEFINTLRSNVKLQEVKASWFKTYENCVAGSELVNYFIRTLGYETDGAIDTIEKLLEKGVIYNVDGSSNFVKSDKAFYRFQVDRDDIAANLVWPWTQDYHKPVQVSADLLKKIMKVYEELLKESDEGKLYIDYVKLTEHTEFSRYVSASSELQGVNLSGLGKKEKNMFFLNVYQCMYIHFILKYPPKDQASGFMGRFWDSNKTPSFYYNIAGMNFTLDDLKNGVLRGNKKPPGSLFRLFGSGDKRKMLPDVV